MLRALFGLIVCIAASSLCFAQSDSLCDEKIFDNGTIGDAIYMLESTGVMARRFEGSFAPVGMEWGEINTLSFGEPFYPWPDTSYDPFEISIWEEEPGTGFPKYPPIWTTVITPSDSPPVVRVYPPDTILAGTNIIFLGMRNPLAPDRAEALNMDGQGNFGGTILSRDGGLTWEEYTNNGNWHIRACLIYPQGIEEVVRLSPVPFRLWPPSPNPFRGTTTVKYSIPAGGGNVKVSVYDLSGRVIRALADDYAGAGHHRATWDGENHDGARVSSGIYLCRMEAGTYMATEKVVFLK